MAGERSCKHVLAHAVFIVPQASTQEQRYKTAGGRRKQNKAAAGPSRTHMSWDSQSIKTKRFPKEQGTAAR